MEQMRAVLYVEPGKLELREVPVPKPGPDEILVKILSSPTCGTDVKTYLRGHPKYPPPFLFGHEFAGEVVEVGARVASFKPGMRVAASCFGSCGECYYCVQHQENLCENLLVKWGTYAEYIAVPGPIVRRYTFEFPDHISYAQAAIVEPLGSVAHGQRVLQIQPGEKVAILGAGGPVGLMHLQMAKRRGASQVIAVDLSSERLELACKLGATAAVNPNQQDPMEVIRDLTGGRGADVVIESAGAKETWEAALQAVRKGGRVLWFGGLKSGTTVEVDAARVHYGEVSIYGVFGHTPRDSRQAFELITSEVIDTRALISGEYPLERVEAALKEMIAGRVQKISINPELPAG